MEPNTIYCKTAQGEAAMQQRTRPVQRNLRMVLIIVDGHSDVEALKTKIADASMVVPALRELERMGLIETLEARAARDLAPSTSAQDLDFVLDGPAEAPVVEEIILGDDERPGAGEPAAEKPARRSLLSRLGASIGGLRKRGAARREEREFNQAYDDGEPEEVSLRRVKRGGDRMYISGTLWVLIGIVGVLVAALLLAILFPYQRYLPQAEQVLSAALQEPVRIGAARFSFTPYPNVTLERLTIGTEGKGSVRAVRMIPNPLSLLGSGLDIRDLQVDGVRLDSQGMARAARWFAAGSGGASLPTARIENLVVALGTTETGALRGEAVFAGGRLKQLNLKSADGSITVVAIPRDGGFELSVSGNGWKLPLKTDLAIDYIDAKAMADGKGLRVSKADLRIHDGILEGVGELDWSAGLAVTATLELKRVNAAKLLPVLEPDLNVDGDMSGRVRLEGSASDAAKLLGRLKADGDLFLSRGTVHRFDLVEAVRSTGRQPTRGGFTKFEQLNFAAVLDAGTLRLDRIRLASGLLSAAGDMQVDASGRLGGHLDVEMKGSATVVRAPVVVAGTLKEPQLSATRISR